MRIVTAFRAHIGIHTKSYSGEKLLITSGKVGHSTFYSFFASQGHPFMESLLDNRALLYSLLASAGFLVCMVTGFVPEINQQFEIVSFPPKVITSLFES